MIASGKEQIAEQPNQKFSGEWSELAADFDEMRTLIRRGQELLEERVHQEVFELETAHARLKSEINERP